MSYEQKQFKVFFPVNLNLTTFSNSRGKDKHFILVLYIKGQCFLASGDIDIKTFFLASFIYSTVLLHF